MKLSEHFSSEEFLPKEIHDYIVIRGLDPRWYIKKEAVDFLEWLKEKCNGATITINTWKWGGHYNWSGLRTWHYNFENPEIPLSDSWFETWADNLSQHRYINAYDVKVEGYSPQQIVQLIEDNFIFIRDTFSLTTVEDPKNTPTWTHLDWRWTGLDYILKVNP